MTDETVKQDREDEVFPEFMTEIVDDLEYTPRDERLGWANRLRRKRKSKWRVAIASGFLILMVALAIGFGNKEKSDPEASDSIEAGLGRIKARLDVLETKIAGMEKTANSGLHEKMNRSTSESGKRYHTVRPGDSLSVIAEQYGITVDRLRKLNQLTANKPIKPGQKLWVS